MIYIRNIFIILVMLVISKNILLTLFSHNDKLQIDGEISSYYDYRLKAYFKAESSLPICYGMGSGILFGGSFFSKKHIHFVYEPTINDNKHTITIPLNYEGLNICDYQLERISLEVPQDNDLVLFKKYLEIEFVAYPNPRSVRNRTSSLMPLLKSHYDHNYTIDFYSMADYNLWFEESVEKRKKSKQLYRNTHKELKILAELILSSYIDKYKKFPTKNEMQRLLSETDKMDYLEKSQRVKKRQKLAENITYVNGTPVDEWGNPFQYKIHPAKGTSNFTYVTLFSFGVDEVESKDDIPSGIHHGLPEAKYDEKHNLKKKALETRKSINILTSLLTKFQYKYKKVATVAEAKELFREHNKFNIKASTGISNLTEADLTYVDNQPVDAWNHPFVYDPVSNKNYPIIYSLGEDKVESWDDIKRKMRRLF